jgi:hypothetical protein
LLAKEYNEHFSFLLFCVAKKVTCLPAGRQKNATRKRFTARFRERPDQAFVLL